MVVNMIKVFVVFFLSLSSLYSQVSNKNEITWNADRTLTLDDFKKIKGKNHTEFAAITLAFIDYEISRSDKKCTLSIQAIFNKSASWVDIEYINEKTLKHEQNHFNIVEIMARMFRKEVIEELKKGKCNIDLKKLKSKYTGLFNNLNKKYDKKTNNGLKKEVQVEWEEKIIPKMLEELKQYSSDKFELSTCDCIY